MLSSWRAVINTWGINGRSFADRIPTGAVRSVLGGQPVSAPAAERSNEEEKGLRWQGAGKHHAGAGVQRTRASGEQPGGPGLAPLPQQHGPPRRRVQLQDGLLTAGSGSAQRTVQLPQPQLPGPAHPVPPWLGQRGAHRLQRQRGHHLLPLPAAAVAGQLCDVAPRLSQPGRCPALPAVPFQRHRRAEHEAGRCVGAQSDARWEPAAGAGGRSRRQTGGISGCCAAGISGPSEARLKDCHSQGVLGLLSTKEELHPFTIPEFHPTPEQDEQGWRQAFHETQLLPGPHAELPEW